MGSKYFIAERERRLSSLLQHLLSFSLTSLRLIEPAKPSQQDYGTFVVGPGSHTRSEFTALARRANVNILRIRDWWLDTHLRYYSLVPSHVSSLPPTQNIISTKLGSMVDSRHKALLWVKNLQR